MVYVCATMWHENRIEMKQILSSIFRLDLDQHSRKICNKQSQIDDLLDPDYYEFEAHVLFDDAMETRDNKRVLNEFVEQLIEVIEESGRAVHMRDVNMGPPERFITPYGGRLVWKLPGSNQLIVHIKDKDKIRHKKRWSQIMYMYYIIGYKIMECNKDQLSHLDMYLCNDVFENLPPSIKKQAENTFFLALDGDVDFQPKALKLLLDRMKNPSVGATCGRIKPGGSGPVVWYQKFEYSIGHWLQKSAEHVFGCVLCSPGCFSLFRARALMDDNVMRTYSTLPIEPRHHLQYDQGEDRWLCTLLLQQGYSIEYCAAAEAVTFAPEEFKEFYNQRRRWLPSTMANIIDLLESHRRTTRKNRNISYLYLCYQLVLLISSILGPSTVLIALESSIAAIFYLPRWESYALMYIPVIFFIFACLKFKTNTQLNIAIGLSALYAVAMMATVVGILFSIASDGWYTPTSMFLYLLIASFILAALLHIHEFFDLIYGVVYFICIPSGYLFLVIYAICNLNNISWGTRETQRPVLENPSNLQKIKKRQRKEKEDQFDVATDEILTKVTNQIKNENYESESFLDSIKSIFRWANNMLVLNSLKTMQDVLKNLSDDESQTPAVINARKSLYSKSKKASSQATVQSSHTGQLAVVCDDAKTANPLKSPGILDEKSWARGEEGQTLWLEEREINFWNKFIIKYMAPLDISQTEKDRIADSLMDYRNKMSFAFFFINALWIAIMTAINEVKETISIDVYVNNRLIFSIEPFGFLFLLMFAILLLLQLIGMIIHRYQTLVHVIAATEIGSRMDQEENRQIIRDMCSRGDIITSEEAPGTSRSQSAVTIEDEDENIIASSEDLAQAQEELQTDPAGVGGVARRLRANKQKLDLNDNFKRTVRNIRLNRSIRQSHGDTGHRPYSNVTFSDDHL